MPPGHALLLPTFSPIAAAPSTRAATANFQRPETRNSPCLAALAPLALALTLNSSSPSLALPLSTYSQAPQLPPSTPFSQAQNLQLGLEDGKIRPCPSTNPACVSTNPKSSSFAFPLVIPSGSKENVIQGLKDAILKTQRNVKFQVTEETPYGQYLRAEVDGGFGRDVMEFLVKGDVVAYRSMATKVTYVYPFTTAFGDSKGQIERMNKIVEQLGWYSPSFEAMMD
ncbi:hypothetical protein Taro_013956 [Colocasia esculenta]|uniref:Thylakoid lumenal 17.9 kDa protein, chloroplastic n=1 Tax=Colocasia esculenta TaxID=4460 RepID=A0A843UDC1_COLES|nr:hypothetical protein [Colocasia esculenta]